MVALPLGDWNLFVIVGVVPEDGAMVVKLLLLWLDSSEVNFVDWAVRSVSALYQSSVGLGAEICVYLLSFVATGNRLRLPATLLVPGLLLCLATVGSPSVWCRQGRRDGFSSSSFRVVRMAVFFQRNRGATGGPWCWLLQLSPRSWSPSAWWKVDLAGLPPVEAAGVGADDENFSRGCVCHFSLYRGVSCKIAGLYCVPV